MDTPASHTHSKACSHAMGGAMARMLLVIAPNIPLAAGGGAGCGCSARRPSACVGADADLTGALHKRLGTG